MEKNYEYYIEQAKKGYTNLKEFTDEYCSKGGDVSEEKSEVKLTIGGKTYELDFCAAVANSLEDLFKNYLEDMGEDVPINKQSKLYKAIDIAYYVINYCNDNDMNINNLSLQKILYYIQAAFLIENCQLFDDEIAAWRYGPAIVNVYNHFKHFVDSNILEQQPETLLSVEDKKIIDKVINAKCKYSALQLAKMTQEETPWQMADVCVTNDAIYSYFKDNSKRIYEV